MMSTLISISLLCLLFPQRSCAAPESEQLVNVSCNVTEGGRHLLQITSPQEQPPIAAAEDATTDAVTASNKQGGQESMPAAAVGNTSANEKTVTDKDNGAFQQYLQGDDREGLLMTSSVYDVSSVITWPQSSPESSPQSSPESNKSSGTAAASSKRPQRTLLMMISEEIRVARSTVAQSMEFVGVSIAIFILLIVAIILLFSGKPEKHIADDRSSDSDLPSSSYARRPTFSRGGHHLRRSEPPIQNSPPPAELRASSPSVAMRMARPPRHPIPMQSTDSARMGPQPMGAPSPMPPPQYSQPPTAVVASVPVSGPLSSAGDLGKPPTSSRYLCPGLVVPKGNECTLVVPAIRSLNVPFFVRDISGKPVIQAEVLEGQPQSSSLGIGINPIVVLRSAMGMEPPATISNQSPLLTYVKPSSDSHGRQGAYIYDARDEIFAHISKNPLNACYVLTSSRMGLQAVFTGTFADHHVSVAADTGKALAEVEPTQPKFDRSNAYYKICVFTQVDVGLILCSLLAIDCLEHV